MNSARLLLSAVFFTFTFAESRGEVEIPDEGLEQSIRAHLEKPEGDLTRLDLESLTSLEASGVSSLDGLEAALNLEELSVNELPARIDLAPLAALAKLAVLRLASGTGERLSDLTGLSDHPNVSHLSVVGGRLSDLNFLDRFPALISLELRDTLTDDVVIDATFLEGHGDLTELVLTSNQVGDPSFLEGLPNLTKLHLNRCGLTEVGFLGSLPALEDLSLSSNSLPELVIPDTLRGLLHLSLVACGLRSLELPAELPVLETLVLSFNFGIGLSLPAELPSLTTLDLNWCYLTSLELPDRLPHLTTLNLGLNQLTSLDLPRDLGALTSLNLQGNGLTHLELPIGLESLEELNLRDNHLNRLRIPRPVPKLANLELGGNSLFELGLPEELRSAIESGSLTASGFPPAYRIFYYGEEALRIAAIRMLPDRSLELVVGGSPAHYVVESSPDLAHWEPSPRFSKEAGPQRVRFPVSGQSRGFFRLRQVP